LDLASADTRDIGFAFAALKLAPSAAAALAERAPREAAARIKAVLEAGGDALAAEVARRRRSGGLFDGIHESWLALALLEETDDVVRAVAGTLAEPQAAALLRALEMAGRPIERRGRRGGLAAELEPLLCEKFKAHAFPEARGPLAPERPVGRWLAAATADEIAAVARELGLKVVARAFSRISRDDLAKLCHGISAGDSVRLVSAVVELNEQMKPEDLRAAQGSYLKIMKGAGITKELFGDAGLGLIGALFGDEDDRARTAIAYRLPEPLGRRILELSARGAIPDENTRKKYGEDFPGWMDELSAKSIAKSWKKQ
jgi:hypothetical protein